MGAFAVERTGNFLQTALVVDDDIRQDPDLAESEVASTEGEILESDTAAVVDASDEIDPVEDPYPELDDHSLDSKALVEGFADRGIACSVLQPAGPRDADLERVKRLAQRSDIVILDWLLARPSLPNFGASEELEPPNAQGPGHPTTSLGLMRDIIETDLAQGSRLRLICFYTATPDLQGIFGQIKEALAELFGDATQLIIDNNALSVTTRSVRIVLIAKAQNSAGDGKTLCAETELPERVVGEFAALAGDGLLPQLALSAIAAIRDNAHRLLARFDGKLDPAFINHRVLTDAVSAESFALSLVGGELEAIITAANVQAAVFDGPVAERIRELLIEPPSERQMRKTLMGSTFKSISIADANDIVLGRRSDELRKVSTTTSLFSSQDSPEAVHAESVSIDLRFASLSCMSRTPEFDGKDSPAPLMRSGTLLSSDDGGYYLCVQPLCDSVRLEGPRARFPLLPLEVLDSDDVQSSFDLVVAKEEGSFVRLSSKRVGFSTLTFEKFDVRPQLGMVSAEWSDEMASWWFRATSDGSDEALDRRYVWGGDLRPGKAVQLIARLSLAVGRVGIDEYEFLRRSSK